MCVVMVVSLLPATAKADPPLRVYIDYDITENTTWHAGDYYICKTADSNEPVVKDGATLTIESGSKVYFSTKTTTEIPESGGKCPYSSLTVTNGSLIADGVTFTTVPDIQGETTWRNAGWNGIEAIGSSEGPTNLEFTDCIFEYSGFSDAGTLYGTQTNGKNSEVNISVAGCTFKDPKAGATAIHYDNGRNTVGTGTISVSDSTFTGYGRGVQVLDNQEDEVMTTVTGCTFSNISVRPLEINGGQEASVTNCTFEDFFVGQHPGSVLIFDTYSATSHPQTVTLTGNRFNYGATANIYPVLIGAGCRINENQSTDADNTFDTDYPTAYRYIQLTTGVGYLDRHRNAVWGNAGIPYLLASEIMITGTDANNLSRLTIEPGVTVCLGDGEGADNLTTRGVLKAVGTADNPITITKKEGTTYGNEIQVSSSLSGSVELEHCVMDGLNRGIGIISPSTSAGPISLKNCTILNTREPMVLNGYNVLVKNCSLIGKGIWIDGGNSINSITIDGCRITSEEENTDSGVGIKSTKSVTLKNCLITGFGGSGINVIENRYKTLVDGAPLIENCTVTGNIYGVVFSRSSSSSSAYGAFILNSIITHNAELDFANKVYISGDSNYPVTIGNGSVTYSLITNDGASLGFTQNYHDHSSLGRICKIEAASYSNRVSGDPKFADTENGDYHLKSTAGRWDGSKWVTDDVTSPCIDAGDPFSNYENEPEPNGGRINLGCYGNTAEASKSGTTGASYYSILVNISPPGGGTVTVSPIEAQAGDTITLTITPDNGKQLKAGSLKYNDGNTDYPINGTSFTMPAANVTVKAEFEDVPTPVNDDDKKVLADIEALGIEFAPGDSSSSVTQNLTLATVGAVYGSTITWTSSNTAVVNSSGVVTRPGFASGDAAVTLTATVYNNGASREKAFSLIVSKIPQITYWVTFNKNGGDTEANPSTKEVISGGNVGRLPAPPTRSGYTFNGWNTQADGRGTVFTATTPVAAPITVYAQWSRDSLDESDDSFVDSGRTSTTSEGNIVTAVTTVTAALDGSKTAHTEVGLTQVSDAIRKALEEARKQGGGAVAKVQIKLEDPYGAESVEMTIPKEAVNQVSEAGIGVLSISTPCGSTDFDADAISALSKEAEGDLKVSISMVDASFVSHEAQTKVGDRPVLDLSVSAGDKTIGEFGGQVLVSVPYAANEGEDTNCIVAYRINDSGGLQVIPNCTYDLARGMLMFRTTHFSLYAVGYNKVGFEDVPQNAWYGKAISFIAAREISKGTGSGNFSPDADLTRGEFTVMLMRAYEILPDVEIEDNFADAGSTYYTGYLAAAKRLGISNGVGDNMFAPDKKITRQEMFTLLYNALKVIGRLPEGSGGKPLRSFTDTDDIASWAKEAMTLLVETGTISGSGGRLFPTSTTTRAEMAQVLYNMLSK